MVITPELEGLMQRPAVRESLPIAYSNIQNRGDNPEALGLHWDRDSGAVILSETPTFEVLEGLDDRHA